MNLDAFYAAYRVDGRSRPPHDPAMMDGRDVKKTNAAVVEAAERRVSRLSGMLATCHPLRPA
jgi:hypothetical protein